METLKKKEIRLRSMKYAGAEWIISTYADKKSQLPRRAHTCRNLHKLDPSVCVRV